MTRGLTEAQRIVGGSSQWVIESSRPAPLGGPWGAPPRTEPCGGAPKRHDNFLQSPTPNTAVRWWMRAVNYCQLWPGRGPNISACRPSTCEGWSVLQNPGGWVDQNVPLPRKWELAESGSYMTAAMLGMLGVTIYIFRKMAISWTINRDLIRSYVDATIYKSKIRWLYFWVIC